MFPIKHQILCVPVLLLMVAGCERQGTAEWGDDVTVIASCADTRTVNDGLATKWQNSDKLSVFAEVPAGFTNSMFNYTGDDTFKGPLPPKAEAHPMYAVYPYTPQWKSPGSISINISSSAVQEGNGRLSHLAGSGFPLYGKCNGSREPSFQMKQLLAVASFNITNGEETPITVKSIAFSAPGPIAGGFVVDITGNKPAYSPVEGKSSDNVSVSVNGGQEIAAGGTASFYVGTVPFDLTGEFSISVTASMGGSDVVSAKTVPDRRISLEAGAISDLNYTFVIPEESTEPVETYIGTFNLVNEDMDAFMEEAEKVYTDSNWHEPADSKKSEGVTIVQNYRNGSGGDNSAEPPSPDAVSYDWPNPVAIPLNGHNGEDVAVTVTGDGIHSQERYTVNATVCDSEVKVYNLVPGRVYHYSVSNATGVVSRGYFNTVGRRRIMKVSDVISADNGNNLRDLGGLKTVDGKSLKFGKVFRGTNIDGLSEAERDYMTDVMNVGLVIDMRVKEDASHRTRQEAKRILDEDKADYSNEAFRDFHDIKNPDKMGPTLLALIDALQKGKAVYIHCFAGADRTGCLSMLIEAVCGVSEKDCTIDYELTAFSCIGPRPRIVYCSGYMGYFHPHLLGLSGDSFQKQAERFMLDCGLTEEQIAVLQAALIEE